MLNKIIDRIWNNEEKRYETLRTWRNDLAKMNGVKPFTILSNRTLREIAAKRPKTEEALREIHGIGPVKFLQYGGPILELSKRPGA